MPPTGILQTDMDEDTLLEIQIQQDLERLNLDDENIGAGIDDDGNNLEINNNEHLLPVGEDNLGTQENEGVPPELLNYINTIQKQRQRFEEELEECDTLIDRAISAAREEGEQKAVVLYDDWKELEEEALRHGMSANDYRKKLLQDIENQPFELEELDFLTADDSEFLLPESALDQVLKGDISTDARLGLLVPHSVYKELEYEEGEQEVLELSADDQMIQKALRIARALELEQGHQNWAQGQGESGQLVLKDNKDTGQTTDSHQHHVVAEVPDHRQNAYAVHQASTEATANSTNPRSRSDANQSNHETGAGTVAVIHTSPLQEFEQYLREQFQLAEERFRQREQQLQQELERRREVEERLMLSMEQQKLSVLQSLQQEEQRLALLKQESQKRLELEMEKRQKVLEKELKQHEEAIAILTAQLAEDRYQLEKVQREEDKRLAQRNDKAATSIQRYYRGYRSRRQHQWERMRLAERREQRKKERQQQRIQQLEQEIQQRREEEQRQAEEIRRAKEEEERKIEEEKRKQEEEERAKKEEAEKRKKEEEERQKKVEEEKKRKEDEDRHLKEEQKRKKQEEKDRKKREEEESKKREEEKKQKEKEEKKRKEEEERRQKEEAEKKRKEEEERRKKEEAEKKRKEEEERRQQEEAEKKRKEEEEKRQKEEAEKKCKDEEERKRREDERKRLEEENRRKQDAEKPKTQREVRSSVERQGSQEKKAHNGKTQNASEQDCHQGVISPRTDSAQGRSSVVNEGRQPQDPGDSLLFVDLEPVNSNILPSSLEERRLEWMKSCLPWSKISNEPWKLKSNSIEKVPRRPTSAKKLPPLPENLILEAAQVASLRQVTTVELRDLPGHSLSSLAACGQLKHVSLTHCSLIALDSLGHCKHLQCLSVQDNLIEYVDLKELSSLYTLNLSHNKLSSIHGLDGCTNLRWLDISYNRLTKLGGLTPLRRLHTLQASHNQLVSCQGLEACPSLQQVDLSANYLTKVQGLDRLGLLTSLNLASNNLTQMPSLTNNVLLQELVLRENSIGPSLDLSAAWLPLLSFLDLSQNIIEQLTGSASGLFVLKRLDLAVNQITEVSSLLPALSDCPRLEDLSLQGNVVMDEDSLRDNLKNSLSSLLCVNGETLRSQVSSSQPVRCFEIMCLNQLHSHRDLKIAFNKECRSAPDERMLDRQQHTCDNYFRFCDRSFRMAVEHRYTHEYGELTSTNIPAPPHTPKSHLDISTRTPRVSARTAMPSPTNSAVGNSKSDEIICQSQDHSHSSSMAITAAVMPDKNGISEGKEKSPSLALSQKEKFELALKAEGNSSNLTAQRLSTTDHASLFHSDGKDVSPPQVVSLLPSEGRRCGWGEHGSTKMRVEESSAWTSKPSIDAAAEDASALRVGGGGGGVEVVEKKVQQEQCELSAKVKFELALAGMNPQPSPLPPASATTAPSLPQQDGVTGVTRVQAWSSGSNSLPSKARRITADMVGNLMMADSRSPLPNKLLEGDLDDLDDLEELMEGLQFDIDGFLDLDQFDFDEDTLEKGWRPEDSPQFPQNYPVLARIPPANSSSSTVVSKPPLPPANTTTASLTPPLGRPTQAWRIGGSDTPLSDMQTRVLPLLRPPSSVGSGEDSQAVTTGRSKREERLAEEWGFKDSRTAELMVQRANKMKYNAERRQKLRKLNPQQRLKLFRRLEEVKGVRAVRPPPPRTLPRKEYFQAQEEEAMQREMEKQMEYRTKAGRTFEWLHTQVGAYDVSSSRINQGGGAGASIMLMKTASDSQLSQSHLSHSPLGYSPMSMEAELLGSVNGHQQAGRPHRHSVGGEELILAGHSSLLPPIKMGSAPSQHSREREKISWRTEPVERSGGWGGGKKRLVRK